MSDRWSAQNRYERLRALAEEWSNCTKCKLHEYRTKTVFGRGGVEADYMLIGEGPGVHEDEQGEPWVGDAGDLLMDLLEEVGILSDDIFLTNVVECHPPNNRDPFKLELEACSPRLIETIRLVDPIVIVPIGDVAMRAVMKGPWKGILDKHGRVGSVHIPGVRHAEPVRYDAVPILHPSYILRTDSIDPTTKTWQEDGPYHLTLKDLAFVKQTVEEYKRRASLV